MNSGNTQFSVRFSGLEETHGQSAADARADRNDRNADPQAGCGGVRGPGQPDITTKFWVTKGSGRLERGKQVQWDWAMYNVSVQVTAKVIEPNQRIVIEWPGYSGPTTVEWTFAPHEEGTFVSVTESGFSGTSDELVKFVADSTQGFSLTLAGLKAYLEHKVRLNLTSDRYPKGVAHG